MELCVAVFYCWSYLAWRFITSVALLPPVVGYYRFCVWLSVVKVSRFVTVLGFISFCCCRVKPSFMRLAAYFSIRGLLLLVRRFGLSCGFAACFYWRGAARCASVWLIITNFRSPFFLLSEISGVWHKHCVAVCYRLRYVRLSRFITITLDVFAGTFLGLVLFNWYVASRFISL